MNRVCSGIRPIEPCPNAPLRTGRRRKHIALLLAYGPEVRAFLHSGLAQLLAEEHQVTVFCWDSVSPASQVACPVWTMAPFVVASEPRILRRWRDVVARHHWAWMGIRGNRRWTHTPDAGPRRMSAVYRLTAFLPMAQLLARGERLLARVYGTSRPWQRAYQQREIDAVIASAVDHRTLPALQTATNLGREVILVTNSWKDPYVKSHLHLAPAAWIVCGPSEQELATRANPSFDNRRIHVAGSLHLQPLRDGRNIIPREQFFAETGLDASRPFVCYTAASPTAVRNEEEIVARIADAVTENHFPRQPQLLVRLNPMEDGARFRFLEKRRGIALQRPDWHWSPERNWNYPHARDVTVWTSTIHYAALNVSIPSTVTLEFATLGRPVINVCFDLPAPLPQAVSNQRYWAADFYADVRSRGIATPAHSLAELFAQVNAALESSVDTQGIVAKPPLAWLGEDAVNRVRRIVGGLLEDQAVT